MTFKYPRVQIMVAVLACVSGQAVASVELRVESRPSIQPIDAYVLATDGQTPIEGLEAADFSITLDGSPVDEFDLVLPPRQDPSQRVSVVVVMGVGGAADNVSIFNELK